MLGSGGIAAEVHEYASAAALFRENGEIYERREPPAAAKYFARVKGPLIAL